MTRILLVGDIHLGRSPGRLPEGLAEHGLDPATLGPSEAWRRTVREAVDRGVEAVVLLGDVVEDARERFGAFVHLADGARRLVEAGIRVLAVAGNHDPLALPRLVELLGGRVELLGAGGTWEATEVGHHVRLLGWSFPDARHRGDPLEGMTPPQRDGRATIGVLHADLDGSPSSPYAPVRRADLERWGLDAWFLGHQHRPDRLDGPRPVGYAGSLCGLDPGEPDGHGPWLVEVDGPDAVRAQQLLLAPVRYEPVDLDLDAVQGAELEHLDVDGLAHVLQGRLEEALLRLDRTLDASGCRSDVVLARVRLSGAVPDVAALRAAAGHLQAHATAGPRRLLFVEGVRTEVRRRVDLEALARGSHPAAMLARRLLSLTREDAEADRLLSEARHRLTQEASRGGLVASEAPPPDREAVRRLLIEAGHDALDRLLSTERTAR